MINEQTYTDARRQLTHDLKIKVCSLLGWGEMEYGQFQYNAGLNYLVYYTGNDDIVIGELESSKMFWNWWKNNWANREEVFVEHAAQCYNAAARFNIYLMIHDALALSSEMSPDLEALGIGELIHK